VTHSGPYRLRQLALRKPIASVSMWGRFTENYTWEQVHAFLSVFGPPRNLQPHYNIAPVAGVCLRRFVSGPG